MKNIYPMYAKEFSCIAGNCPDTCCAGWEIVIDDKFQKIYKSSSSDAAKYAVNRMYTDSDGDVCLRLENGRCPMLNDENLCRIYIDMGKEALCDVCRIYPRFNKECEDVLFSGISLSCPEAARLIFEDKSFGELSLCDDIHSGSLKDILNIYAILRNRIIGGGIFNICIDSEEIQDELIFGDSKRACGIALNSYDNSFLPQAEKVLESAKKISLLEILTDEWNELISRLICHLEKATQNKNYLKKRNNALSFCAPLKEIKNIGIYYLYKYMPEAIYDGYISIMTGITYSSICIIAELYAMELMELGELSEQRKLRIAQLFSKELEHNEDNLNILF